MHTRIDLDCDLLPLCLVAAAQFNGIDTWSYQRPWRLLLRCLMWDSVTRQHSRNSR
jgi:hypothetical protein